jgi:hypothetical protein
MCVTKFRTHMNANDYEEMSIAKKKETETQYPLHYTQ